MGLDTHTDLEMALDLHVYMYMGGGGRGTVRAARTMYPGVRVVAFVLVLFLHSTLAPIQVAYWL